MSKRFTNTPYECPRCGYVSAKKSNLKTHFYNKKKFCPASVNGLELTEEIKKHVLENRTYKPVQQQGKGITQVINNYNQLYSFVGNIDDFFKLKEMIEYKGVKTVGYGDKLEQDHEKEI